MKVILFLLLVSSVFAETLHLTIASNPSRLNPILATDSSSSEIANFIFSALVKYDKSGKKIVGDLAKEFYFEDNRTLVFKLRRDVYWHDGVKFSADDVLFTFNLINSKQISSPYTSTFREVQSVEVLDKYRLKVRYKKPYFKALEVWMMGILPKHILQNENNLMSSSFNKHPIGTGPYKLTKLIYSKNIELSAFDKYYEHKANIETISFHVVADNMTRFLMLKSQQIDVGSLDAMQYERQINQEFKKKFNIYETTAHAYSYLGFNLKIDKFKNKRLRKALSLAINRQELVDILFFKHAQVCNGPFLPGGSAYNENVKAAKYDPIKAKKLLKELGYDKKHPFEFELSTSNSNSVRVYAAQIIQHQLSKVGVKVKLRVMEWQAFLNTVVFPRKFETVLLGWSLSLSPDPYLLWHSASDRVGGFNFIGYHNSEVDNLINTMQSLVDRERVSSIQKVIFKKIVDDIPYLFLFIPNDISAVNSKIKNIQPTINGIWYNYIDWQK